MEVRMRGLVLEDVRRVVHRTDLPEPTMTAPTDAVVAVRRAGLCGSDLHPYEGREAVRFGVVCGHEAVGEVVAAGSEVGGVGVGDRVLVPFTTSCGACGPCRRGLTARCVRGELFGFGPADDPTVPALHGCQAQYVRVPLAGSTLVRVPDDVDDTAAVLLTDNLPTAWCAVERTGLATGDALAVIGLGAVGLCAVAVATATGAGPVLAVDPVAERRRAAALLGAEVARPEDAVATMAALVPGEGVTAVVEAAGTTAAQHLACALLRPGGTLSVIAVQTGTAFGFTPVAAYDANLTVRFGRASVRAALDRVLPRVDDLLARVVEAVLTGPVVDLADGPDVYARFARRDAGSPKVVFSP
jgi:threonine dehydrogenase-like Zn-dependent dehydrogenase